MAAALVTSAEEVSVPVPSAAEPVTAVMTIQPSHATAGETVEVLVRVRIASAHFIHAPGEAGGPFIPVSVNATFPAGLEPIGDWQLPPPEKGAAAPWCTEIRSCCAVLLTLSRAPGRQP